jgi:predicted nuclease of predicted toxin-antitoxin system
MPNFLVDSCIAVFAVNALREAGHTVERVPESGADPGDEVIIQKAFDQSLVLVTADKDFGDRSLA